MKKGFTLIELLAIISILAIVLLVAIPKVIDVINDVKQTVLVKNNEILIKATKNYLSANQDLIPTVIGQTIEIPLATLTATKFITQITDSYDNSSCTGYILVTKLEYDMSYTPHLNCELSINNSSEDGLVAHYKFDDFKESTTNLIGTIQPSFNSWGTPVPTGISEYFVSPNNNNGIYTNITYNASGGVRWMFSNNGARISALASTQYTVSAIIKWNGPSNPNANLFYLRQFRADNSQIIEGGLYSATYLIPLGDGWYQAYRTFTTNAETTTITFESYQYSTIEIWMYNFQLERKDYYTAYTPNARNDNVTDYSMSNLDFPLMMNNTPKWIKEEDKSYYLFNGSSTYMDTITDSKFNLTSTGTIMVWAKPTNAYPSVDISTTYKGLLSKTSSGGTGGQSYYLDWNGTNTTRNLRGGIGDVLGMDTVTVSNFDFENKWKLITLTWNGTNLILYANDKELARTTQTRNAQVMAKTFEIGRAFVGNGYIWNGYLDDVRVYNRALNQIEIRNLYNSTK